MLAIELTTESEEETHQLAAALAAHLQPGDVVALEGPLGSGKTCFVRGLAEGMGINPRKVSSPTYIICQEYGASSNAALLAAIPLVHIDAYRISSADELETIGWSELVESGESVIAVEWASRIIEALPAERIVIEFQHLASNHRLLSIAIPDHRQEVIERFRASMNSRISSAVECRTCNQTIDRSRPTFPFCSDRCRLADLGKWFNEGYRMSRPVQEDEELED